MEKYRKEDYNKTDSKEQEEAIEEIAEALDYLKGQHKKNFLTLYEAEKEE